MLAMTRSIFLLLIALPVSCVQTGHRRLIRAPASAGSVFEFDGQHSAFGAYKGELEVRPRPDGRVDVIRAITYESLRFDSHKIQQVWSGEGELKDGRISVVFQLKAADVLSEVDGVRRSKSDFSMTITVPYSITVDTGSTEISTSVGIERDRMTGSAHSAGPEPIYRSERRALPSKGDSFKALGAIAINTIFLPITHKYRHDPFISQYSSRPEFTSENQYFIQDATDFSFLRANRGVLRIANKVVDKIALTEALLRASAYGPTLKEKAQIWDLDLVENHLNELGLFSTAIYDLNGQRIGFGANGDGALWSGTYAGSQAMRWLATKEPQALENFKRVTKGMMLLMDITGEPGEFARTAHPMIAGEKLVKPWRQGASPYQNLKWIEYGNNDMIKGLFHAFAWAYEILPDGDPFLVEVTEHAKRLPDLRISREKNHPGNGFSAAGLFTLATRDQKALQRYLKLFSFVMKPVGLLDLDQGFYYGGIADWSGINLNMIGRVSDILIAKNLARRMAQPSSGPTANTALAEIRYGLLETWATYATSRRDFLTIAADAFAASDNPLFGFAPGTAPVDWPKKNLWPSERAMAVWSLREMPVVQGGHSFAFDYSLRPDWSASAWPKMPWKAFGEETDITFYYQGAYNFPFFEGPGLDTDNAWTSAFQFRGGGTANYQHGRTDYLHSYWMARLSGLIDESH